MMGTPKKTKTKKPASKINGAKKPGGLEDEAKPQKRIIDDDDFDEPLDDLDGYASFNDDDDDDDDFKY